MMKVINDLKIKSKKKKKKKKLNELKSYYRSFSANLIHKSDCKVQAYIKDRTNTGSGHLPVTFRGQALTYSDCKLEILDKVKLTCFLLIARPSTP